MGSTASGNQNKETAEAISLPKPNRKEVHDECYANLRSDST